MDYCCTQSRRLTITGQQNRGSTTRTKWTILVQPSCIQIDIPLIAQEPLFRYQRALDHCCTKSIETRWMVRKENVKNHLKKAVCNRLICSTHDESTHTIRESWKDQKRKVKIRDVKLYKILRHHLCTGCSICDVYACTYSARPRNTSSLIKLNTWGMKEKAPVFLFRVLFSLSF